MMSLHIKYLTLTLTSKSKLFFRNAHTMRHLYRPSVLSIDNSNNKSDNLSKSLRLMLDLGLIKSSVPGMFHLLPIALKSLEKLEKVIDHFMQGINAQKIRMPALTSSKLWSKTGRLDECRGELFTLNDRLSRPLILSPTHEEAVCELVGSSRLSHKQLPLKLYQITEKYRDELRPRFGLLRGREFLMKDLYIFDKDEESSLNSYSEVNTAYAAIFDYLGIKWIKARGAGGSIGGNLSHEFHLLSNIGEDRILVCNDCGESFNEELLLKKIENVTISKEGAVKLAQSEISSCIKCASSSIATQTSIEVGHSFLLGTKYTKPLNVTYHGANDKPKLLEMGCFGLGVTRILASAIEILSEETHIRWPLPIAPYLTAIVTPKAGSKEEMFGKRIGERIYDGLVKIFPNDVLVDDRSESTIGKRVKDLKMLGIPYIIVLGKKLEETPSTIELIQVYENKVIDLGVDQLFNFLYNLKSRLNFI